MADDLRALLEKCRHHLTALTGLEVCDGASPDERWRLDESALVAEIDKLLAEREA